MNNIFKLLKNMLKTSYDTSDMIDSDTRKINKKSIRVWILGLVCVIIIYLSYIVVNSLKEIGMQEFFVEIFFLILQVLVMFETVLLVINILYFSKDMENYLSLPISSRRLLITKFAVMISIILGSEVIIAIPAIFIYGVRALESVWFYPLSVIVLVTVTVFLSTIISIIMIFVMKIFRFIKSKYLYQNLIILIMTIIISIPLINVFNFTMNNVNLENSEGTTQAVQEIRAIIQTIKNTNKYFIVTELGASALSEINLNSLISVLKIIGLDILALLIFFYIGRFTYIKDVLWNLSMFDKKKSKRIKLYKNCKLRNKKYSYMVNEIKGILKNPTYFMHYIYKILIILTVIISLVTAIFPIFIQAMKDVGGEEIFEDMHFEFSNFSLIIGIIQAIFTFSSLSLTAISRYGKSAIFFKYIPMKFNTQFRLKNIPQLIINTIIILVILGVTHKLIPEIGSIYILLMFIVAMLLNIINCNILLILDLLRPSLNYENDITVIKQNDNKLFQYILTVVACIVIWYIKEVTEEIDLNIAILVEVIVFSVITLGMEIFIQKKANRLFRKII